MNTQRGRLKGLSGDSIWAELGVVEMDPSVPSSEFPTEEVVGHHGESGRR